jgi:colanic acid biosynthesis glycosyl transferase WcaI
MDYTISPIQSEKIDQIVKIHLSAFPDFFLTFLGPRFLKEFYSSFVIDPAGIGFVVQDAKTSQVCGVIVGPLNPAGYFKRLLKRRWWAFCFASLAAVLKKPAAIKRLYRAIYYRGDTLPHSQGLSLLSSIAVSPDLQSTGLGRVLVNVFIKEVQHRGGKGVFLTTDAENNDHVNRFYAQLGFTLESSFNTPEGRKMNRYVFTFNE